MGGASDSIRRETVWIACESRCVCVCVEQSGVCLEALVVCIWKYIGRYIDLYPPHNHNQKTTTTTNENNNNYKENNNHRHLATHLRPPAPPPPKQDCRGAKRPPTQY